MTYFKKYIISSLLATSLLLSFSCYASQPQLLLYPTRLVLDSNEHSASVILKNTGNGIGDYKISFTDMVMPEAGAVREAAKDEEVKFSAKSFLRLSPRSVTLQADEEQNIRIMVRKPANLEAGEYRTHLKVMMTDNVENKPISSKNLSVTVRPQLALVMPIIIRYGNPQYKVSIVDAKLKYEPQENGTKKPFAYITFIREGNRSCMGDITITYIDQQGKNHIIKNIAGIPIYRPTEKRIVNLDLDVPDGVKINGGKLNIVYRAQEKEGGKILAEANFNI
jgi:P pilus assembly chaperone PapD